MVKTLTITDEAYNKLKSVKQGDESFSKAVIRVTAEKGDLKRFFGLLKTTPKEAMEMRERVRNVRRELNREMGERIRAIRNR